MILCRRTALASLLLTLSPALFAQTFHGFVPTGTRPQAIAVNSFTDRIYTINEPDNSVTEIDGATNVATLIPLGVNSQMSLNGELSINPFTNTVYAVEGVNLHLAVIDGATRNVTLVPTGVNAYAVAANPFTNKIYVANFADTR